MDVQERRGTKWEKLGLLNNKLEKLKNLKVTIGNKQKEMERANEEIKKASDYMNTLKIIADKVLEAVNNLNIKVMDQMFDTMSSIFSRVNSHPLFTEINMRLKKSIMLIGYLY